MPKGGQHAGKLRVEDFLDIKKTQLKGAKAEAVTDKKKVRGHHSDGAPLICSVQGVDKHGDGLRQEHLSHTVFNGNQPCCAYLLGTAYLKTSLRHYVQKSRELRQVVLSC